MRALNSLKNNKNIKIMKADKGNVTVVLDNDEYEYKMKNLLTTNDYTILQKNPMQKVKTKTECLIRKFEKEEKISVE